MRSRLLLVFTTLFALAASIRAQAPSSPYDRALEAAKLDPRALVPRADRWREGGKGSLPLFDRCWDDPWLIEPTGRETARALLDAAPRLFHACADGTFLVETGKDDRDPPPRHARGSLPGR